MSANVNTEIDTKVSGTSEMAPAPKDVKLPLQIAFADELPDAFVPCDELVQGLLTVDGCSVLYGDSNCGKTFLAIDLAAAVARGVTWMGRRTELGLVVYLAAESPQSVAGRLQGYQKHHGVRVPNFAIVQNPVNLFKTDADTASIIKTVRMIEEQRKQKVRLIVGDTLARLSAGANENAGQDMGVIIERIDRIRNSCKAHFLLIHHSGKNAAAGARGWSGLRAAVDVEIEVTEQSSGRCAEITKDRDLGAKGERIGFTLNVLEMSNTKWGAAATTCVVMPANAPERRNNKKLSAINAAILAFLQERKTEIKKVEIVENFKASWQKAAVYRAIKELTEANLIQGTDGMVAVKEVNS